MLLLILTISFYHLLFVWTNCQSDVAIKLHALIITMFIGFVITASNPFVLLKTIPENGLGLNPILQDVGLSFHPPILYIGYVGFSIIFVLAIASLINGKLATKEIKQWLIFSFVFLTLGIAAGSWWAYRELGWGGYWFWDPVENVSIMPWLIAVSLLHALLVYEKRQVFGNWVVVLAISGFILSLIGIFLVRSGILTSVHSFAADPSKGIYILLFIAMALLGSCFVMFKNSQNICSKEDIYFISRETGIMLSNIFLVMLCLTVLIGTIYPIIVQLLGLGYISVAEPYFNTIARITTIPFLIIAIITPALAWKEGSIKIAIRKLLPSFIAAAIVSLYTKSGYIFPLLSWWLIFSMVGSLWTRRKDKERLIKIMPMFLSHVGIGLLVLSIAVLKERGLEKQDLLKYNQSTQIAEYKITLNEMYIYAKDNYLLREGIFSLSKAGKELTKLKPQIRFYPLQKQNTSVVATYRDGLSDIYITIGEMEGMDKFSIRLYYKPMVNGIWLSAILMALSGVMFFYNKIRKKI